MTDRDTRTEIERVVRVTLWGELGRDAEVVAANVADALIAAGLVVPSGLTAEKLREIAKALEHYAWTEEQIGELREWADALSTQETP
jgi:hypothetical protein